MAVKKKKTENQKAFQKERKRLQQVIRRGEKQGYIFPEDIVPPLPKRVTKKALEKIKRIKPSDLYSTAEYLDKDTGEIVPAEQRRQEVKNQGIEKAKKTRKKKAKKIKTSVPSVYYPVISIIDTVRGRIEELQREAKPLINISQRKNALLDIFDDTVSYYDLNDNLSEYETYLKQHEGEIADLLNLIAYDSDGEQINASFVTLGRLINVTSLSMEQAENLSAMSEYYSE